MAMGYDTVLLQFSWIGYEQIYNLNQTWHKGDRLSAQTGIDHHSLAILDIPFENILFLLVWNYKKLSIISSIIFLFPKQNLING